MTIFQACSVLMILVPKTIFEHIRSIFKWLTYWSFPRRPVQHVLPRQPGAAQSRWGGGHIRNGQHQAVQSGAAVYGKRTGWFGGKEKTTCEYMGKIDWWFLLSLSLQKDRTIKAGSSSSTVGIPGRSSRERTFSGYNSQPWVLIWYAYIYPSS